MDPRREGLPFFTKLFQPTEKTGLKRQPLPGLASEWGGERRRGRKRGSIQLSPPDVSMVMAPEAGQNFLSGNKQQLSFTITQAC